MKLHNFEQKVQFNFNDLKLLEEALTHSSFSNEEKNLSSNYEKMEFIGDAVLELAITDLLMVKYRDKSEGQLSKARSLIVNETVLASIARELKLGDFVRLGKGELSTGGNNKDSILSSALEAVIGAVYRDSGFEKAYNLISRLFSKAIKKVFTEEFNKDYKTRLQEFAQSKFKQIPVYEVINIDGPPHCRNFEIEVRAGGMVSTGKGNSKKQAEQDAAQGILQKLEEKLQ